MKKKFFTGMAVLLIASLFFLGCPTDSGDDDDGVNDPVLSGTAALGTGATVKGVAVVFVGSETGADLDHAVTGTVVVAASALSNAALSTAFTAADSGTSKAVYVAPGSVGTYSETIFDAAAEYADATALAAGGVFFVKVTSQDGSTAKWYKVTVLEAVSNVYSLKTTEGPAALPDTGSGLEILSAGKDASGAVTIRLGGTLDSSYVYTAAGSTAYPAADPAAYFDAKYFWIGASGTVSPAAGKYANVFVQGLFSGLTAGNTKIIAIQQTNQALRFFSGTTGNSSYVTDPLDGPKTADGQGANYIPTDTSTSPVRWRVYNTGAKQPDEIWGFLIYDGALTPKTATFEITERANFANDAALASNPFTATVTVDYSAVDFGTAAPPALALSKPTWANYDTPNAANVNEMLTRLWDTSAASVVQDITVGNVFSYAPSTKTLTVNKGNATVQVKQWITTQWGGTTVPVKVNHSSGVAPNGSTADQNWSGAHLIWIDVATVTAGSQTISLTGGGTETYTIAVTP
ncbi:MAG: hypothetical protein LBK61_08455 [Spirochaetaceae bacterium]|jgi:hypothetical protein|nr:hypothetical protein [Spirochaetaceae bacterium]